MAEGKDKCVQPARGPILGNNGEQQATQPAQQTKEAPRMIARVGKPAPDFEASAYINGGFQNVRLSDYKGKWIVLCFYPGDFTFV